jgi:effector-binding domain-containing protein
MALNRIPIGTFSLITRLSQKALRLYDDRGLLVPELKDRITGYRYYEGSQIAKGVSIKTLCMLGFSLSEITTLLNAKEQRDTRIIGVLFRKRREEIRSEVHRLQKIEAILQSNDASLELTYMTLAEPVIKEVAPLRVISKRDRGVYQDVICRLAGDLCAQIAQKENDNPAVSVTGPLMTLYHDEEYREKDADVECALPITGRVAVTDPSIEVKTIPGGSHLTLIYQGAYPGLHEAWSRIFAYQEEKGYRIAGPGRELYLNDPAQVPEEDLLTELHLPIIP